MRKPKYQHVKRLGSSAWQQRAKVAGGTGLLAAAVASFMVLPSHAISDITAPTMSNLVLSSTATSSSPTDGTLSMTADFVDDLSGVHHVDYVFTSPSGGQTMEGQFNSTPLSGDTYFAPININEYAESGVWTPTFTVVDQSGNTRVYTEADLELNNMNGELTVSGTEDVTAPSITAFTPSITSGDMTEFPINFYVDMTVSEDLSGIGNCVIEALAPTTGQKVIGFFSVIDQQNPDTLRAYISIDQLAEAGTWTYRVVTRDNTGNSRVYDANDLQAGSFQNSISVTGTSDSAAPSIVDIHYDVADPVIDEVPFGGGVITMTADFADNLSGVQSAQVDFTAPTTTQTATGYFQPISGTTWRANVYLPVYAASGAWTPKLTIRDNVGNVVVKNASTLVSEGYNLSFAIAKNITGTVANGGTLTSDVENDGATPTDIVEATVTTPVGGDVSIVMIDSQNVTNQSNGYIFFGRQVSINTPTNTVEDPMTLTFRIDASVVPSGESASTMQITKNGVEIAACTNNTTADPDPCVFSRVDLPDGDIEISVHSTTASVWASGFPATTQTFDWQGFKGGLKDAPTLNKVEAGDEVTVKFDLNGNEGLNILEDGYPMSQKINCNTKQPIGEADSTNSQKGLVFKSGPNVYRYDWKTRERWEDSCRQFILKLTDGTEHKLYFKFKD